MSDAAFREALREYHSAAVEMATQPISADRWRAAEARVLTLYAEAQQQGERDQLALAEQVAEATVRMEQGRAERQGEEYEVDRAEGKYMQLWRTLPERWEATLKPGDRVRVTKVEEGA